MGKKKIGKERVTKISHKRQSSRIAMNLNRISNTLKKRLAGLGAENISITGPNEKGRCEVKALLFGRVEYKCVMNSKTNFVSGRADAVLDEMSENERGGGE